jgi:hypothetical protein
VTPLVTPRKKMEKCWIFLLGHDRRKNVVGSAIDVSFRENGTQTQSFLLIDSVGMIQISLRFNEITLLKIAITDRGNRLEK